MSSKKKYFTAAIKPLIKLALIYAIFVSLFLLAAWYFKNYLSFSIHFESSQALILEPLFLLLTFLLLLMLTARVAWSVVMTCLFYVFLLFANREKIENLLIPVMPHDLFYLNELFNAKEALGSYGLGLAVGLLLIVLLVVFYFKNKKNEFLKQKLLFTRIFVITFFVIFGMFRNEISNWVTSKKLMHSDSSQYASALITGFLTHFYKRMVLYKSQSQPLDYSKNSMYDLAEQYHVNYPGVEKNTIQPNVIIFFIEAFTDPTQAGFNLSYDPIPHFRKLKSEGLSGTLSAPVIGGLSANSEFELLTGLNMDYIPKGSIPYVDTINRPMPSLAQELSRVGYDTHAVHVARMSFFNYQLVYPLLGFDSNWSLYGNKKYKKDAAKRYPNESELVKEIIKLTEQPKPQFVFSFPNSTHGFWNYKEYLQSDLEVTNWSNGIESNELKTYINALHHADKAVGELVEYFKDSDEPTVILIAGDHMPSLPVYRFHKTFFDFNLLQRQKALPKKRGELRKLFYRLQKRNPNLFEKSQHEVPFVIWSNYENLKGEIDTEMYLINHYIRSLVMAESQPFYRLLSEITIAKESNNQVALEQLMSDYEKFQYDILYGEQYYMNWLNSFFNLNSVH